MKRLVVCADGTWNVRDQVDESTGKRRPTNVTKVARTVRAIAPDGTHQVVGYFDGVGTGGPLDKFTGGAFGDGMCRNVVALYRFLLYNYVPGDELYFFGFSRGAFTVRTLAGFMNYVGLLDKDDDYFVPEVFGLYERRVAPDSPEWQVAFRKSDRRACPAIRYIGVWDTVGSLGAPGWLGKFVNGRKYAFHDVGLSAPIQNAYHALAIDEHRVPFAPTLWQRPPGWPGELEQAWFAGVHSNVGGSYKPDGAANEALHWLVEKAERLGLAFDNAALAHYEPHFRANLNDSMTALYRPMGKLLRDVGKHVAHGEKLHRSVLDRYGADAAFRPKNLESVISHGVSSLPIAETTRVGREA